MAMAIEMAEIPLCSRRSPEKKSQRVTRRFQTSASMD
jgi:hypothetical protein